MTIINFSQYKELFKLLENETIEVLDPVQCSIHPAILTEQIVNFLFKPGIIRTISNLSSEERT